MLELLKRAKIILPTEHGSWSLLLTPFIIGAGLAATLPLPLWLCLIASLSVFFARQPLTLWLRVRRGKAKSADAPAALFWSVVLMALAAICGVGMLIAGRWAILWIVAGALIMLGITLAFNAFLGPRQLAIELAGVVGLALAAPAAYLAATNRLDTPAALAWAISALHNVISVLFVRLRIDQKHGRATSGQAIGVIVAHGAAMIAVGVGAVFQWMPALVALPIALLLLRAIYVGWKNPPLDNVKRFGFTEMGFALAFALIVIAAFVIKGR